MKLVGTDRARNVCPKAMQYILDKDYREWREFCEKHEFTLNCDVYSKAARDAREYAKRYNLTGPFLDRVVELQMQIDRVISEAGAHHARGEEYRLYLQLKNKYEQRG